MNSSITLYNYYVHLTSPSFQKIYKIVRLKRVTWLAPAGRWWKFKLGKRRSKGISEN